MEYLIFLQNLRDSLPKFVSLFFTFFSDGVLYLTPVIIAVIYLTVNKKVGRLMIYSFSVSNWAVQIAKLSACIYRPWIKEPRIKVSDAIAATSTGYSFPSAHTALAVAGFGSIAVWQRKKKWLVTVCIAAIILTAFARNFLGVHTLEDVIVGAALTALSMYVVYLVYNLINMKPDLSLSIMIIGLLICVVSIFYIAFKNYPIDLDAAGNVIVDPITMLPDGYCAIGYLAGTFLGDYIERKYINFEPKTDKKGIIYRILGILGFGVYYLVIAKKIFGSLDTRIYHFIKCFTSLLIVLVVIPLFINLVQKRRGNLNTTAD